jgi:hypothetical protein
VEHLLPLLDLLLRVLVTGVLRCVVSASAVTPAGHHLLLLLLFAPAPPSLYLLLPAVQQPLLLPLLLLLLLLLPLPQLPLQLPQKPHLWALPHHIHHTAARRPG